MNHWRWLLRLVAALLAVGASNANAAYSCNVSATNLGALYTSAIASFADTTGSVTLTCTRASGDANTLSYRIKASDGQNPLAVDPFRQVRLSSSSNTLQYIVNRGTSAGATATCGLSTTWRAPSTGNANVMRGTLSFGSALSASVTWNYCFRVRSGTASNPTSPTMGLYTDVINIFAQYPGTDAGALSPPAAITYTVGVGTRCLFTIPPTTMTLNYTSFSRGQGVLNQSTRFSCSTGLSWSAAISPTSVSTALGINYTVGLDITSGAGIGTPQRIITTVRVPAGQVGQCTTSVCQVVTPHTLTITY